MKKSFLLPIIVLFLGVATYFVVTEFSKSSSTNQSDSNFAVLETDVIHKIFLADKKGNKATLLRQKGQEWQYQTTEGERYKARPGAVDNLLNTIKGIQIRYVVAPEQMKLAVEDLAINGVKVELYDRRGKNFKTFYVGGPSNDQQGTFMIMEGSDQPYVTHLGHWEGVISTRFMVLEEDWRDRTVLSYNSEDIKSVAVNYPQQKNNSFRLTQTSRGKFEIQPLYPTTPVASKPVLQPKAQAYLYNYEKLVAEAFENKNPNIKDYVNMVPFCEITVTDKNDKVRTVKFLPVIETLEQDDSGRLVRPKVQRYFAFVNGQEDVFLVQDLVFQKIFWGYSFFFV